MKERLRIAMVTDAIHPYHRGGKEVRYAELTRRLSREFDVHVYTMNWWRGPRTVIRDGVTFHALCRAVPLYTGTRRSIPQAVLFAVACLKLLWARFDVLEADHMPYLQLYPLRLVAWLRRTPLVVTWHEVWGTRYWTKYMGPLGLLAGMIEWVAMLLPDRIVAASPETADRLHRMVRSSTEVLAAPNGVDLDTIEAAPVSGEQVDIVAVGRLLSHKRIDMLLDALAILHSRGERPTCCVIGTGPEARVLLQQAIRLGLASTLTFDPDVEDQASLYGRIKASRVFVAASEREGFGIAALEAIACGVPVVTTSAPDNHAQHLVARSARGIVCTPDAVALADAITLALKDDAPAADQVEGWLSEYGWDATAHVVARALRGPG